MGVRSVIIWSWGVIVLALGLWGLGSYGSLLVWFLCQQAILMLSYDLLGGIGRELHLGHGAFFGLGAYLSAICLSASWPWGQALLVSGSCGALCAKLFSPILVELRGSSFALASLSLVLLGGVLARNLEGLTGGVSGLSTPILPREIPYGCSFLLFLVSLRVHEAALASRWGRALMASGEDPVAAAHLGVSAQMIRSQALTVGSTLASLAGSIYVFQSSYVSPESAFGLDVAMAPVVGVLLGGPGTRWGPLLGASLLVGLQELIWTGLGWGNLLFLGLALGASGLFLPEGIVGALEGGIRSAARARLSPSPPSSSDAP